MGIDRAVLHTSGSAAPIAQSTPFAKIAIGMGPQPNPIEAAKNDDINPAMAVRYSIMPPRGAAFVWISSRQLPDVSTWFRVQGSEFRVQGSGFRVQGSGFRVQGSGFRVQGLGITAIPLAAVSR